MLSCSRDRDGFPVSRMTEVWQKRAGAQLYPIVGEEWSSARLRARRREGFCFLDIFSDFCSAMVLFGLRRLERFVYLTHGRLSLSAHEPTSPSLKVID